MHNHLDGRILEELLERVLVVRISRVFRYNRRPMLREGKHGLDDKGVSKRRLTSYPTGFQLQ